MNRRRCCMNPTNYSSLHTISRVNMRLYVRKGPVGWRPKGCLGTTTRRRSVRTTMPQNAELKYAGNVREGESRYSIITGLLHLQLIPDRTVVIHSSCLCEKENEREREREREREKRKRKRKRKTEREWGGLVTKSR